MRDRIHAANLMERCVKDIRHLLLSKDSEEYEDTDGADPEEPDGDDHGTDVVGLWDGGVRLLPGGRNYEDDW
jgi:hypothetical protein